MRLLFLLPLPSFLALFLLGSLEVSPDASQLGRAPRWPATSSGLNTSRFGRLDAFQTRLDASLWTRQEGPAHQRGAIQANQRIPSGSARSLAEGKRPSCPPFKQLFSFPARVHTPAVAGHLSGIRPVRFPPWGFISWLGVEDVSAVDVTN